MNWSMNKVKVKTDGAWIGTEECECTCKNTCTYMYMWFPCIDVCVLCVTTAHAHHRGVDSCVI